MAVNIPIMAPSWPENIHKDSPVTPRENLMLALNHEKPYWAPRIYAESQIINFPSSHDMAPTKGAAGVDWFGTNYVYSDSVGINMPAGGVLNDITEWREKVVWPDLDAIDWAKDLEGFQRDESKALYTRFSNGIFERLHAFEGFEQCLMDIFLEPEECRAFFERYADYKISLFNHISDVIHLDFLVAADDYGTAKAPFFSNELYEEILLEPTMRYVKAVQARGTKFIAHCCGKVEAFMPYFADVLKVDGVEIQDINDLPALMKEYGDRLTIEIHTDPQICYDDESSDERLIAHIRDVVDTYGAHNNPGAGAILSMGCCSAHGMKLLEDELYSYSLAQYKDLH